MLVAEVEVEVEVEAITTEFWFLGAVVEDIGCARCTVRPVAEHDWPGIHETLRVDHAEEDQRAHRPSRPPRHTDEALALRRGIAEHADYLGATDDHDQPAGFICPWPTSASSHGIVEDLFVRPDQRRRGLATSLIAAAVEHTRRRGADEVAIAADPTDTPKALYQRLGFVPHSVSRACASPSPTGQPG